MTLENEEVKRLQEQDTDKKDWLKWGPYLSERQWGTVREDYSANGDAWNYFPHEHARSRAYRWGEDGIAGLSDRYCNICFGIGLWNGKDTILKERLFGLTGPQGNHGEDVKELYYYLESTPTHSYMKHLYKYPQASFPYEKLVSENQNRNRNELEYELLDTGVFENNAYFDVFTEYAKSDDKDILIKITIHNRNSKAAKIHLLPTLTMRNHWTFKEMTKKPVIKKRVQNGETSVSIEHPYVGDYNLYFQEADQLLFTENETNREAVYLQKNTHPFKKDLFHKAVLKNDYTLATKNQQGTKFAPLYHKNIEGGASVSVVLRLSEKQLDNPFGEEFNAIFSDRKKNVILL